MDSEQHGYLLATNAVSKSQQSPILMWRRVVIILTPLLGLAYLGILYSKISLQADIYFRGLLATYMVGSSLMYKYGLDPKIKAIDVAQSRQDQLASVMGSFDYWGKRRSHYQKIFADHLASQDDTWLQSTLPAPTLVTFVCTLSVICMTACLYISTLVETAPSEQQRNVLFVCGLIVTLKLVLLMSPMMRSVRWGFRMRAIANQIRKQCEAQQLNVGIENSETEPLLKKERPAQLCWWIEQILQYDHNIDNIDSANRLADIPANSSASAAEDEDFGPLSGITCLNVVAFTVVFSLLYALPVCIFYAAHEKLLTKVCVQSSLMVMNIATCLIRDYAIEPAGLDARVIAKGSREMQLNVVKEGFSLHPGYFLLNNRDRYIADRKHRFVAHLKKANNSELQSFNRFSELGSSIELFCLVTLVMAEYQVIARAVENICEERPYSFSAGAASFLLFFHLFDAIIWIIHCNWWNRRMMEIADMIQRQCSGEEFQGDIEKRDPEQPFGGSRDAELDWWIENILKEDDNIPKKYKKVEAVKSGDIEEHIYFRTTPRAQVGDKVYATLRPYWDQFLSWPEY